MKKLFLGTFAALIAFTSYLTAESQSLITHQGKLVQGTNLVNGNVAMKFRVYTNDVGGDFVYEETGTVSVVDGYYSFQMGKQPSYGQLKQAVKHDNTHIEMEVNGEVLHPRTPFSPPPFAKSAEHTWNYFGGNRLSDSTPASQ